MAKVIDARSTLSVNGVDYEIHSLAAVKEGHVGRLPYSLKILLENLLRHASGGDVRAEDISALANWEPKASVEHEIEVVSEGVVLGTQKFRLLQPSVAFKVTTLADHLDAFAAHARRLLAHTRLEAIQWVNVGRHRVTFTTIKK